MKKTISKSQRDSHLAYNRCVTSNGKKLSRLNTLSMISSNEMNDLVKSMAQICDSMFHEQKDELARQRIDKSAISTSNRLRTSIRKNQNIIDSFNSQNDEEFMNLDMKRIKNKIKRLKSNKYNKKASMKRIKESEKEVFSFVDPAQKNEEVKQNEMYQQKFQQIAKLQKLKGEILMMEQKKKYAINKKYEPEKFYSHSFFFRKGDAYGNKSKAIKVKSRYMDTKPLIDYTPISPKSLEPKKRTKIIFHSPSKSKKRISSANSYSTYYSTTLPKTSTTQNGLSEKQTSASNSLYVTALTPEHKTTVRNTSLRNTFIQHASLANSSRRPFSSSTFRSTLSVKNSRKRFLLPKDVLQYVQDIHLQAYEENKNIMKLAEKDSDTDSKKTLQYKLSNKKKTDSVDIVDINKINKDLGFDPNDYKLKQFDENALLLKNAEIVSKKLDDKCKVILRQVVQQMMNDQARLNKEYVMDSLYERKLYAIKLKEQFQKVCDETIGIEKQLLTSNGIEPDDEKSKIIEMLVDIFQKKVNTKEEMKYLVTKSRVMKNIQPDSKRKKKKPIDNRRLCEQEKYKNLYMSKEDIKHHHHSHH